ncbi:MAG: hypothetical protein U9Q69_00720 [Nanoarchaeota archaeon]|nr:hypothetical protein [Nanoarchaeota archaeon]
MKKKEAKCKKCGAIYELDPTCDKVPSACVCTCESHEFQIIEA